MFEAHLTAFNTNQLNELNENEISVVSGGNPLAVGIAAAAAGVALFNAAEAAGEKIGKFIFNATH